uniref:Uncharacterized protein n=1 Tax=Triticum urartu TaxID=4572 RepID=A0A8R7V0L2_TRIUA
MTGKEARAKVGIATRTASGGVVGLLDTAVSDHPPK